MPLAGQVQYSCPASWTFPTSILIKKQTREVSIYDRWSPHCQPWHLPDSEVGGRDLKSGVSLSFSSSEGSRAVRH